MKRILLKIVLTFLVFFIVGFIELIDKVSIASRTAGNMSNVHEGTLLLYILSIGMITAIIAIWKYNPEKSENTDITLKKDND